MPENEGFLRVLGIAAVDRQKIVPYSMAIVARRSSPSTVERNPNLSGCMKRTVLT
jgi:hypothetical protein